MLSTSLKKTRKRIKFECELCGTQFDDDYRKKHEEKYHSGKRVKVKQVGAPANPFVAAKTVVKEKERQAKLDVPVEESNNPGSSLVITESEHEHEPTKVLVINTEICSTDVISNTPCTFLTNTDPGKEQLDISVAGESANNIGSSSCNTQLGELMNSGNVDYSCFSEQGEYEVPTWMTCAGQLKLLTDTLHDCNTILNELKDNVVHPTGFLTRSMDTVQLVNEISSTLLNNCMVALENQIGTGEVSLTDNYRVVQHDPGNRGEIKTSNERQFLIALGPHQPRLNYFPTNQSISAKKQCRFSSSWYKQYPHLEYSITNDSAYCFVCGLFPTGVDKEKAELTWIRGGCKLWHKMKSVGKEKLGKLAQHFSSQAHKSALSEYCHFMESTGHVDILIDKKRRQNIIQEESDLAFNTQVVRIIADVTRTLGRQGLAFRGSDDDENGNFMQIIYLMARHCTVMKKWLESAKYRPYHVSYLNWSSQNEMIDLLGTEVKSEVVREVEDAGFYSVMADSTPDTSHKDRLAVVVRIVNKAGIPKERLLQVSEERDKTGEGIASEIIRVINSNKLDTDNIAFQSYDFASAMSGIFNGAQQKLSDILGRVIPYIPCQAHRLNTFVEHSCNASLIVSGMFDVLESLYVFFSSSTKRYKPLLDLLSTIENSLQLRNLSRTRWTARAEAIQAVWTSYESIILVLRDITSLNPPQHVDQKTKTKAIGLLKKVLSFDFILALMFMRHVMYKCKVLTKSLESPDLNIIDAGSMIDSTIKSLESINKSDTEIDSEIDAAVAFAKKVEVNAEEEYNRYHRPRHAPKRFDERSETEALCTFNQFYRKEFKCVLDTLITLMKDNLKSFTAVLDPLGRLFATTLSRKNVTQERVQKLTELFPKNKPDSHALCAELEILADQCDNEITVKEILQKSECLKQQLPLANQSCRLAVTAPVTVASDERTFSKMKFVKNCLRSSMGDSRMESLMLLACEKDIVDNIKLEKIVKLWAGLKNRRIKLPANSVDSIL